METITIFDKTDSKITTDLTHGKEILVKCELKPDKNTCYTCMDDQINNKIELKCSKCEKRKRNCTVLALGTTFFGKDFAIVESMGSIKKVPIDRIMNIFYTTI